MAQKEEHWEDHKTCQHCESFRLQEGNTKTQRKRKSTQRVAAGAEGTHLCAEMGADSEQLMDFPAGSEGCKEPSQVHLPLYMLNT